MWYHASVPMRNSSTLRGALMTTTTLAKPSADAAQPDPYLYGWRYVRRELPDGGVAYDQVPLTLEDVLHPQEGDQVTHSKAHQRICKYLTNVFEARLSADPTAVVLDDVRVAWDVPDLKPHGPDIAVIFGVRKQQNWSTFDVAKEGVRPTLIIEVTSPETRGIDRSEKLDEYEQAGVPFYVIIDSSSIKGRKHLRLVGYHRTPNGYDLLASDKRGWLWLEPVGVWIGVRDDQIECYDESGNLIDDYTQLDLARAEAEARAETAEARAKAEAAARVEAEVRLHSLEAELRRLRSDG
jgi:Uma2 family endonuclease